MRNRIPCKETVMHEFLKEYGPFIIAAVAILVLIALISSDAVQDLVKNGFTTILQNFTDKAVNVTTPAPAPTPTP